MSSIHQILNPLSPFLREKKLAFLRNAALLLDRDLHDEGFFADAAELFSGREEALRVCAPAFAADGMDRFGRPRRKRGAATEREPKPHRRANGPDGEEGPFEFTDAEDFFDRAPRRLGFGA